ncbi:nucleoside-triphosphatase [Chloroflexota bacterium]
MASRRGAARSIGRARVGLLTGPVGIGKTTIAESVVGLARRHGLSCGGLLAPAMHNSCGQKLGIWGLDLLTGDRRQLAATDRILGDVTVGPYSFDPQALDWACGVIEEAAGACDLLLVDEIGKLELWQGTGLAEVLPLIARGESRRALVLVRESLLSELRRELGSIEQILYHVDLENRSALPNRIVEQLLDVHIRNPKETEDGKREDE